MKTKKDKDLAYYMSLNYPFTGDLYEENGELRFGLQIPELQGVWADGKTIEEAYVNLVETKRLWFETCFDKEIDIPEPVSEKDFSGKFILRLEPRVHRALSERAQKGRVSLNQYIRLFLEKQISNSDLIAEIRDLKQFISIQSETINELTRHLSTLEHRIGSLEEALSSTSGMGWGGIIYATTEEHFKGGISWGWDKAAVSEETMLLKGTE